MKKRNMKRNDILRLLALATVLGQGIPALAQVQDSLLLRDYQYVKQQDAWLTSGNAAALTRYQAKNIAEANLSLRYNRGGLTDYYESPEMLRLGAAVESFYRVSRRTVVFGSIAYENANAWRTTGSAWMNPTRKPFDIVEATLDNPGKKHRDTYQLTGAVGVDLGKGLSLGAQVDYTGANYAKYKDLRHKNKLMDLTASVGLYAPVASWLNVGANYRYHRNTESITFSMYGKDDRVYNSLISYGAMMGPVEQFGIKGYTDKSNEMPWVDDGNGAGLQLDFRLAEGLSFYNHFTYLYHKGYYGRKSPTTITYANHKGHQFSYEGVLSYKRSTALHQLAVKVLTEKIENFGSTYRELINDNGAYYYEYYESVKTGQRRWATTDIDYTGRWGIRGELPTWTVQAGLHFLQRKQIGILYPYYRRQSLKRTEVVLRGERNFFVGKGVLSAALGFSYAKGSGDVCEDGAYVEPQDGQSFPASMDAFLYREYQYLTAPQIGLHASAKYAFLLPSVRLRMHVKAGFDYRKASETYAYSLGNHNTQLTFAVGCTF